MNGLPAFTTTDRQTKKQLTGLIDTGASNNYITLANAFHGKLLILQKPIFVKTIHGTSKINYYVKVRLFRSNLKFFVIEKLDKFDLIVGLDGLRQINAKIDLTSFILTFKVPIVNEKQAMNYLIDENLESTYKDEIATLVKENTSSSTLPYNTSVKAEIRTISDSPIWTKQYAYPASCNAFVNKEIKILLDDGIISPSKSPYNSPIWIVPKRGFNEDGSRKQRLVLDHKKLNSFTVFDRYPVPNTNIILSNLGEAKFFSKLDLEAGYHQILVKEEDREKTAFSVNGSKYEFNRLPFGLKNSASIFQRTLDDIFRPFFGLLVYIYIDEVIIYGRPYGTYFSCYSYFDYSSHETFIW